MISVIGLGEIGSRVANCFDKYPQYTVYNISPGEDDSCSRLYKIDEHSRPEDYESLFPVEKVAEFLDTVEREILFVVSGGDLSSAASLVVLQQIAVGRQITILYVRPEEQFLTEEQLLNERAVRGVLQQYALSGVFKNMCIVDNAALERAVGNVSISKLYPTMNSLVANSWHMVNVFRNTKPVMGSIDPRAEHSSVLNIGVMDPESGHVQYFSQLGGSKVCVCLYGVPEDVMESDADLLHKIKKQSSDIPGVQNSKFAIYSTSYDYICAFVVEYSREGQKSS